MPKLTDPFNRWNFWKKRSTGRHPFATLQDYLNKVVNPGIDADDEVEIRARYPFDERNLDQLKELKIVQGYLFILQDQES